MSWVEGGCHCGAVRFRVRIEERDALDCNCSICTMKGLLHLIVTAEDFVILAGEASLSTYTFGTHTAKHHFCPVCGVHPFYVPRSHPDGWDVNVRCLDEGIDGWSITPFDGLQWDNNIGDIR